MEISNAEYEDAALGLTIKYKRRFTAQDVREKFWVIRDRKGTTFFHLNL